MHTKAKPRMRAEKVVFLLLAAIWMYITPIAWISGAIAESGKLLKGYDTPADAIPWIGLWNVLISLSLGPLTIYLMRSSREEYSEGNTRPLLAQSALIILIGLATFVGLIGGITAIVWPQPWHSWWSYIYIVITIVGGLRIVYEARYKAK